MVKSLYVHIPFCRSICSYCDFCKFFYDSGMVSQYLDALEREVRRRYRGEELETIYIGGGTPSCLASSELDKLFSIISHLKIASSYEFTFECNVQDLNEDLLQKLKKGGVNRLSIGIETINSKFYQFLNRYNEKRDEIMARIDLAKKYFSNINVDFMYAFPKETMADLDRDLVFFQELNVSHISIYSLIIEPNTRLSVDGVQPISEDLEADMYYHIVHFLTDLGYQQYEISNFARKGCESQHNLTYWNNEEYYGFGLSSGGYVDHKRYLNTRSFNNYIVGKYIKEEDDIDQKMAMENEIMLGLRKTEGIDKKLFFQKYGLKLEENFDIMDMIDKKLLEDRDGHISIPLDKLYISNHILVKLLEAIDEQSCSI